MKSIKYFAYLLFIIACTSLGCKKGWLEEKSDKSLVVPATLNDFQALMDNLSMNNAYPSLGEDASDGHYVSDVQFQNIPISVIVERDAYIWSKSGPHVSSNSWNGAYSKILVDNIVLDGLDKYKPDLLEQEQWNDIKGQALYNRSRLFFELAQIYAPPFNPLTAERDLGIVLRLTSDITVSSNRSTVAVTYDQIIKDLKDAKSLLSIRPKILTRGSASAVNALLTRVYLCKEDYENAFIAADMCLKQYSELLDYNDVLPTANFIGRLNKEVLFHSSFVPSITGFYTNRLIDQFTYDSYHVNDLRKTRFFRVNSDNSITFKGNYESRTSQFFNGPATDEIYLSRAECYARAGKTEEAMRDLNDLIAKRWNKNVPFPAFTASTPLEALTKVLEERKKELIFRGVRWMDLRRLNKDPRFAVTLERTVLGVKYSLEPNSYKYTFPIPDDIIQQTGIKQNPGWP
jgi:tetratricopeptide (TPR) repeat protein